MKIKRIMFILMCMSATHTFSVHLFDTTEPFDIGFTDFEMYGGIGGLAQDHSNKELGWEGVIAYQNQLNF